MTSCGGEWIPPDPSARPADVEAVFEQVRSHAELIIIPEATHVPLDQFAPEIYWPHVDSWIAAHTLVTPE